jgi:hypothetical protein
MQLAREAHFRCLQLELVCGLPGQTPERWQATLQTRRWPLAAVHDPDPAERRRRQGSEMLRCRGVLPAEVLDAGLRADLLREAGDALIPGVQGLYLTPEGRYRLDALCALVEGPGRGGCSA